MNKPKFQIFKTTLNGKPAAELVVRNATYSEELDELTTKLGYVPTVDMANRRSILVTTKDQAEAARSPLAKYFDAKGEWVNEKN
jgi:hypothetical protein